MKVSFACPACGQSGMVDQALVGRRVQCKPCRHRFVIPAPAVEEDDDAYPLEEPPAGRTSASSPGDAVFVPSRGDEPSVFVSPRKPRSINSSKSWKSRDDGPEFAWGTWLLRVVIVAAIVIGAIALFAPRGLEIAGTTLVFLGTAMFLLGFAAGAFGAFSEDFLYGFLYLAFPIYTAYYFVTRWEDLWKWSVCSVAGVGCVSFGTAMLHWAGVAE